MSLAEPPSRVKEGRDASRPRRGAFSLDTPRGALYNALDSERFYFSGTYYGLSQRVGAMVIRISEIPDEGVRVDSPADLPGVLPEAGWNLDRVGLLIERRGQEVAVSGSFEATARLECSRCLEPLVTRVVPDVDLHLLPSPGVRHEEVELGLDDLEVDFYQGDLLDVEGLLRGEMHLALPVKPLCRAECRGLCPLCGGNRNLNPCACETRGVDPRLAPLEALRRRQ